MAESMQRAVVLDRAPDFAGVELVARYRPASLYQLGGDWWDAFELPGGRLALAWATSRATASRRPRR